MVMPVFIIVLYYFEKPGREISTDIFCLLFFPGVIAAFYQAHFIEGHRSVLRIVAGIHKSAYCLFQDIKRQIGIQAGAVGPEVEDPVYRQRVGVLDAAGKVALAGHRQDQFRPSLNHDSSGNGAAGGNGQMDVVMFTEIYQLVNGTFSTPFAIVYGIGEPHFTLGALQTVGHEQQQFSGLETLDLGLHKVIVDLDKRGTNPIFWNIEQAADQGHERQEQADG